VVPLPLPDISGYAGPRRRILIVDNEPVDRRFLQQLLGPLGFEVSEAASGIEALRLVPHVRPELLLLDINMPGINGWETARLLRANFAEHIPIIVISADGYEHHQDQGVGIAPRDFLVKPVSVATLLARVREKLDLVWIARGSGDADGVAEPLALDEPPTLPPNHVQTLRDLGALGHIRGILDKLDEIDRLDARYRGHTAKLRSTIKAFQLGDFLRDLESTVR
jgi:CheY-like chemotaxis protein